ncbi:hypothetical protein FRC06_001513, partial [Ceratobasidium sp. 370]
CTCNVVDMSDESSKWSHIELGSDTATESESEYESLMRCFGPVRIAAERIVKSCSGTLPAEAQPSLPVHTRLRGKVLQCYFDSTDCDAEAAGARAAGAKVACAVAPDPNEEIDKLAPTDLEEVPETEPNSSISLGHSQVRKPHSIPAPAHTQNMATQHTYGGTRSYAPCLSNANAAVPDAIKPENPEPDDPEPIAQPNSPSLTTAELI